MPFPIPAAALAIAIGLSPADAADPVPPIGLTGNEFAVAAPHPLAAEAGAEALAAGGNVVDAAAAMSFALSAVRPQSSGIGGGGFLLVHLAGRGTYALDFRETAPALANPADYLDAEGKIVAGRSTRGGRSVAVPGHVKGLAAAIERFGRRSLGDAVAPAVRLAREGFTVDAVHARATATVAEELAAWPGGGGEFVEFRRVHLAEGGQRLAEGSILRLPELAATLERIGREGPEAMYRGELAERIVKATRDGGGTLTAEDLAGYAPKWREPLSIEFTGRLAGRSPRVAFSMPPPSSGGPCVLQALATIDRLPATGDPAEATRRRVEALRHAFADRAALLGDPDATPAVDADVARMLSPAHRAWLAAAVERPGRAAPDACGLSGERLATPDDGGTSHCVAIDAAGNCAAITDTVNLNFGSWIVVPGTGILLNDQMDDFAIRTDMPNDFGLLMGERNLLAGGRRPLSSMSPTIVVEDGKAIASAGAAGGPRIISATVAILAAMLGEDASPDAAVAAPRAHHQWMPDRVTVEGAVPEAARRALEAAGHAVRVSDDPSTRAVAAAAALRGGKPSVGADSRGGGGVAGR
jgi:gamma-glutamyltranspeptidase/glutathione hydrolase